MTKKHAYNIIRLRAGGMAVIEELIETKSGFDLTSRSVFCNHK